MKNFLQRLLGLEPSAPAKAADTSVPSHRGKPPTHMPLEQQLSILAGLGLKLNEGITVDDLLFSWGRSDYEDEPFDLLLFAMGSEVEREPWGRPACDQAWNFDMECVEETGAYVAIVNKFARISGMTGHITDIEDFVDIEQEEAWLQYTVDGRQRRYEIAVNDDWADPETVSAIMEDLQRGAKRFYAKDNGQASIWFYLDEATAAELNALTGNALQPNA